jgi:phosphatidylserine/phosphatidylglycerophosphate/cardiolipin synthase-like enzyme
MLDVRTHTDGGQAADAVAERVTAWLGAARTTLDLALYDVRLPDEVGDRVAGAIKGAAARGVQVRIAFNQDERPPDADERPFFPAPPHTEPHVLETLGVPVKPIPGWRDLMHHKYVVRDGEAVWTGSMNWTDDSFSIQENVLATVRSVEVARAYAANFAELWAEGDVERSGFIPPATLDVTGVPMRAWFTPGFGEALSHRIAKHIGRAKRRVRICSPVITTAPVLATLAQLVAEGKLDVAGCVDAPQVGGVIYQWRENGNVSWKLPLLEQVMRGKFSGKPSTPWEPGGRTPHDFMHAKVTVADDAVFLGSFNLSRSGETNAENVLELHHAEIADRLAAFIDEVRALYPPFAFR